MCYSTMQFGTDMKFKPQYFENYKIIHAKPRDRYDVESKNWWTLQKNDSNASADHMKLESKLELFVTV